MTQQYAPPLEKIAEIKVRHERDATLRDIDHATTEWRIHRDRAALLTMLADAVAEVERLRGIIGPSLGTPYGSIIRQPSEARDE